MFSGRYYLTCVNFRFLSSPLKAHCLRFKCRATAAIVRALVSLCSTSPPAPPRSGLVIQSQHLLVQLLIFVLLRLVPALQRGQALAPLLVDDELSAVDLRVGVLGSLVVDLGL